MKKWSVWEGKWQGKKLSLRVKEYESEEWIRNGVIFIWIPKLGILLAMRVMPAGHLLGSQRVNNFHHQLLTLHVQEPKLNVFVLPSLRDYQAIWKTTLCIYLALHYLQLYQPNSAPSYQSYLRVRSYKYLVWKKLVLTLCIISPSWQVVAANNKLGNISSLWMIVAAWLCCSFMYGPKQVR